MASRHKYGAVRAEADGYTFHSTKERNRYLELKLLEKAGEVKDIQLQPSFKLEVNGQVIGFYRADFDYQACWIGGWLYKVEDVKGFDTPLSKWKRKHVKAQYGIEVLTT